MRTVASLLVMVILGASCSACSGTDAKPAEPAAAGSAGSTGSTGGLGGAAGSTGAAGSSGAGASAAQCPARQPVVDAACEPEGLTCEYAFPLTCPPGCSGEDFFRRGCIDGVWVDVAHTAGAPECYCPDTGSGGAAGSGGDCFAPDRNTDRAYSGEIPGCACDDVGSACVGSAALICDAGKWIAVEDGPCMPSVLACDGRLDGVGDCVALFEVCVQLDTGTYCGMRPRTADCTSGLLVQTSADCYVDGAYCLELPSGLWCTSPAAPSCPEGYDPVTDGSCQIPSYSCFQYSESLACRIPTLSSLECGTAGGTVYADPGDGSLMDAGCPDGATAVAFIAGFDEGGLCCVAP